MKNKYFLIIVLLTFGVSFAQSPEKMSYQAIVRNGDGNLLSNTKVGVKISILRGSTDGTVFYSETQTPTTNDNGLFNIEIGTGSTLIGTFSNINWGSGTFFIKSEIDPEGASNYSISGTSQLLSVPYALHAKTADNIRNYKVGDFAKGGIVFWVDETGQHGLVSAKTDQNSEIQWFAGSYGNTQAKGSGIFAGKANNSIIIAAHNSIGDDEEIYAARLCNETTIEENNVVYGDWYLPSRYELTLMYQSRDVINSVALANGGAAFLDRAYWSSTEETISRVWVLNFTDGEQAQVIKNVSNPVRAIRAF